LSSTQDVDPQIIQQSGQLQVVINGANMVPQLNQGILDLSIADLSEIAINKQAIQSRKPLQMGEFVTLYNNDIKEKQRQLVTRFTSLFQTQQEGLQFLEQIIRKFNGGLRQFSNGVEETCIELMTEAYRKQFFKDMKSFDDLDETSQKLEELQKNVSLHNLELAEKRTGAVIGTAITAITGVVTGDYSHLVENVMPYLAEFGSSLYVSLSNTEKIVKETRLIVGQSQSNLTEYSPQQRIQMEEKAFDISKFYCLLGFNLQLKLNGTDVTLIGGKIEYDWLLSTIILLDKNIDYRITKISLNKDATMNELYELSSLKQRLYILKAITQKLNEIVNFSMYTHLSKLQISPGPKTLEEIEKYFNDQLQYLLDMLEKLNKTFPLREQQIQKNKEIIEANNELDRVDLQLQQRQMVVEREFQEKRHNITQAEAEMKAAEVTNWWVGTKTYLQSYFTVFNSVPEFIGQNLNKFTRALTDAGLGVPLGFVQSIFGFLNNILWSFVINPSGYVIIGVGILVLAFFMGGITGMVRVFRYGRDTFVYITYGTFSSIYRLVSTPFGLIYRRVDTIAVNQTNQRQIEYTNNQEAVEALLGLRNVSRYERGGKRTKRNKNKTNKRKNKNRKNKTKKRVYLKKKNITRRH
jgi:tetrahydromethanopterin S-methyltransferase subunit G